MTGNPKWAEERARIDARTAHWSAVLGLNGLGIHVRNTFAEAYDGDDHLVIARTTFDWEYRAGSVEWFMARTAALSDDDLDEAIIHEYVHCLNASCESTVKDKDRKLIEFAAETLTQSILHTFHYGETS